MNNERKLISALVFFILATGISAGFDGGVGSQQDPYRISTCDHLQNISGDLSSHYELVNDIDCSTTHNWNIISEYKYEAYADIDDLEIDENGRPKFNLSWPEIEENSENVTIEGDKIDDANYSVDYVSGVIYLENDVEDRYSDAWGGGELKAQIIGQGHYAGFDPIGNESSRFMGSLDGNDHTISNLYFDRFFEDNSDDYRSGIFAVTGIGSQIKNLKLRNSYLRGHQLVGGIVGDHHGNISNVLVEKTKIDEGGGGYALGGIVGQNWGNISNTEFRGELEGAYGTGGIAGIHEGHGNETFRNVTSRTNFTMTSDAYGGIVGEIYDSNRPPNSIFSITNSSYEGTASCPTEGYCGYSIGGITGWAYQTKIVNSHADVKFNLSRGYGENIGGLSARLISTGSSNNEIINSSSSGTISGAGYNIGGLTGVLSVESKDGIKNSFSHTEVDGGAGDFSGNSNVGGAVGYLQSGKIKNVYSIGNVAANEDAIGGLVGNLESGRVEKSYSVGSVNGNRSIGALIGKNQGTVADSYYNTDINGSIDLAGNQSGVVTGSTGLSTSEMTGNAAQNNMQGYDFSNIWSVAGQNRYPYLSLLQSSGFKANTLSDAVISVDWSGYNDFSNIDGFNLYYGVGGINESKMIKKSSTEVSHQISKSDWSSGDQICVEVRPYNNAGEADSDQVCTTLS